MFLHSFEGSWLSHPFWKTKFVLTDPADLQALLKSGVSGVWIDVGKGDDVPATSPAPAAAAAPAPAPAPAAAVVASMPATPKPASMPAPALAATQGRTSMADELKQAAEVMSRSVEAVTTMFGEVRMGRAVDAIECLPMVDEIVGSVVRNPAALISLARLKTKDDYTYMHSVAVCALMVALSRQLGLSDLQTREAGLGGLLHDIGKMLVPMELLNKPGALSADEFSLVRLHPQRGYDALKEGGNAPAAALEICLRHHEKIDGSGYPGGHKGDEVSMLARMGAVCDVYDAITSTRPYKNAWDPAGSIQRMAQWQGHFDPLVFQAFVKSVGIYPVGTLVRLQSQRLAIVVDQNPASLVTPIVRDFFSAKTKSRLQAELIDLSAVEARDKIVSRETALDWGFTGLDELWRGAATH
jgi:HD-GYP domain-containing protein (c-di-GMP phosphodiesterase class II)